MEERTIRVIIGKSGGAAGKNSVNYKVTIPKRGRRKPARGPSTVSSMMLLRNMRQSRRTKKNKQKPDSFRLIFLQKIR